LPAPPRRLRQWTGPPRPRKRKRPYRPRIFRFPSGGSLPQGTVANPLVDQKGGRIMATARADPLRPSSRPVELEDPLNRFVYHPLAVRLARLLVPTGISPNLVSVGSALCLLAATWSFVMLAPPANW